MTINLEKLVIVFGEELAYTSVENGGDYFDLYNADGDIVAMNGDEVDILKLCDKYVVLTNLFDGKEFTLSLDEFGVGVC